MNKFSKYFDHTCLKPYATREDMAKLCEEAKKYDFMMVAINSTQTKLCKELLKGTDIHVGAAISFPLGQTTIETKVFETKDAIEKGAQEIDMVINIAMLKDKEYDYVENEIHQIVEAAKDKCPSCATIAEFKDYLVKRSQWIIGGDGASYDIGYGGLDHVIASGEDVNILVLDTEVYSNTGGQSSKATPLGAIAKFAASGKRVRKKDLGMIATTYGYVYVAQIAMGADQAQTLKAIREAEAYPGPSLVIAYAPCINHGLKAGMGKSQAEEAKAVECGYWHLWRFNPALEEEGKNPFSLDSKEPNWEGFQDYLKGEVRFASVMKQYPTEAADLFAACEDMAKKRYASYKRMAAMDWSEEK